MALRLGSALSLAALLAGCVDSPTARLNGWNDYAMATREPVMAQPSPVVDPSFRIDELRVGMSKAQLEAMYPGRLAFAAAATVVEGKPVGMTKAQLDAISPGRVIFDKGDGHNELYFVEPQAAIPNSTVSRDRLSLWLNDGRLATFGLVSTNEPVLVASAPTMSTASTGSVGLAGLPPPPNRSAPPRGKYAVQIAAARSEPEARAIVEQMRAKFPGLLGREWATISRVSLPNGEFYRVVIGPLGSPEQAGQLCNSLRAQGADCIIRRT